MAKKLLNLSRLYQITALFSERGWNDMTIPTNKLRFDNFCRSFGQLDEMEFLLILDLTKRFHNISLTELVEEFLTGYYCIPDKILQNCQHLLIVPMKKMDKDGYCVKQQKSGDMLMAQMQQQDDVCYYNDKFIYCKNARDVNKNFQKGDLVCFIDDFVGTGKTYFDAFQTTCDYLVTQNNVLTPLDVIGVSAWAMNQGKIASQNKGLRLFCYRVYNKEITDYYPRPLNIAHVSRMYNMEKIICGNISRRLHLGYGHCEALVSIAGRCANNTFPVYWKPNNATFPR
jgi:hypothetical protein